MIPVLVSLVTRLGFVCFPLLLGMGAFLFFHGFERTEAQATPLPGPEPAMHWRDSISVEVKPKLLALTRDPVDLAGDALDVLYILQKDGEIVRVAPGGDRLSVSTRYGRLATPATDPELGFSAIEFHPDFLVEQSPGYGRFYVVVAEQSGAGRPDFTPEFENQAEHHQDVVYEYVASSPLAGNFSGSRRELIRFSQPGPAHNVASLEFDHRGFLYIAVGDGALAKPTRRSPSKNASSLTNAYGKVLRIDPLGSNARNGRYGIPDTNPFRMVSDAMPEIWSFGLRAPHSLAFDAYRQSLYLTDVAIGARDRFHRSDYGGEHYGWDLDQGSFLVNLAMRKELEEIVSDPILQLGRIEEKLGAATGAFVYRGEMFPALTGRLVFATHDGQLFAASPESDRVEPAAIPLGPIGKKSIAALRTTPRGEIALLCADGAVLLLTKGPGHGLERSRKTKLYCLAPDAGMRTLHPRES